MKIKGKKFEKIQNSIKAVVEHFGKDKIQEECKGKTLLFMMWSIWTVAYRNLQYDDLHPHFASGAWYRIIPTDKTFDMYSDDDNDTHFDTALKAIAKNLGLTPAVAV